MDVGRTVVIDMSSAVEAPSIVQCPRAGRCPSLLRCRTRTRRSSEEIDRSTPRDLISRPSSCRRPAATTPAPSPRPSAVRQRPLLDIQSRGCRETDQRRRDHHHRGDQENGSRSARSRPSRPSIAAEARLSAAGRGRTNGFY